MCLLRTNIHPGNNAFVMKEWLLRLPRLQARSLCTKYLPVSSSVERIDRLRVHIEFRTTIRVERCPDPTPRRQSEVGGGLLLRPRDRNAASPLRPAPATQGPSIITLMNCIHQALSITIINLFSIRTAATSPATSPLFPPPHTLVLRGRKTACLSAAKSNYLWITDGVSKSIAPDSCNHAPNPPLLLARMKTGGRGSPIDKDSNWLWQTWLLLARARWRLLIGLQGVPGCSDVVFPFQTPCALSLLGGQSLHRLPTGVQATLGGPQTTPFLQQMIAHRKGN